MQNYNLKLKNKKIAILVENMYQDLEVWYPYYRFKEEGAEVLFIGSERREYIGKYGYPVKPHITIDEADPNDFDAVIIPGGFAPDYMRRVRAMVSFVRAMFEEKKVVAAICHGGWMLVSARILKGKTATSFFAIKDDMINAGANWMDQEVVKDKNLITSRNPDDLPAFCREIIETLSPKKGLLQRVFGKK